MNGVPKSFSYRSKALAMRVAVWVVSPFKYSSIDPSVFVLPIFLTPSGLSIITVVSNVSIQ